ncbi:MAG: aromatic acid exporter family protein [Clostridium sp.]
MEKIIFKKIGMRNIKTALSVFLCIIITKLMGLTSSSIACIAAVITMESTIYNSYTVGKNRLLGTTIGSIVALCISLIAPNNVFFIGIGVACIIYLCDILHFQRSISIACVVFIVITLSITNKDPFIYSVSRLLETSIGIIIAVLVNFLVCPPKLSVKVHDCYLNILLLIKDLVSDRYTLDNKEDLILLYSKIREFDLLLNNFVIEYSKSQQNTLKSYNLASDSFLKLYKHLYIIEDLKNVCTLSPENYEALNLKVILPTGEINSDIEIVYNYHVEKLIFLLSSLNLTYETIEEQYKRSNSKNTYFSDLKTHLRK